MTRYPLQQVRSDGWFDRLLLTAPQLQELADAIGDLVVAYIVISGLRIHQVQLNPQLRETSLVTFSVGDQEVEHTLTLRELRRQLAEMLSHTTDAISGKPLGEEPSVAELQDVIGFRTVLLAPLFGVSLQALLVEGDEIQVEIEISETQETLPLSELHRILSARVAESAHSSPDLRNQFEIKLELVEAARAAIEDDDPEEVVTLLGGWPGPLSILMRTPEGEGLPEEKRAGIVEGLGLLGRAYLALGNREWAEDVLRLAVQWGYRLGGATQGRIFAILGESMLRDQREGAALGLFLRALRLGVPRAEILPPLARCFAALGQPLEAAVCAEEAANCGAEGSKETLDAAAETLGPAWEKLRTHVKPRWTALSAGSPA